MAKREDGTFWRFLGGSRTMYIRKMPIKTTTANLKMLAYLSGMVVVGVSSCFKPAKVCPLKGGCTQIDIPYIRCIWGWWWMAPSQVVPPFSPMNQGLVNLGAQKHFQTLFTLYSAEPNLRKVRLTWKGSFMKFLLHTANSSLLPQKKHEFWA